MKNKPTRAGVALHRPTNSNLVCRFTRSRQSPSSLFSSPPRAPRTSSVSRGSGGPRHDCIGPNLNDEQTKVRTVTSLAIAALADASNLYFIENDILNPLWTGARRERRREGLAGFLKAVGYITPLMDEDYANYYTSQIMERLLREFASRDEEMKKVVLKVISQCAATDGVTARPKTHGMGAVKGVGIRHAA